MLIRAGFILAMHQITNLIKMKMNIQAEQVLKIYSYIGGHLNICADINGYKKPTISNFLGLNGVL